MQLSWEWPCDRNQYDTKHSATASHPWQSASVLSFYKKEWIIGLPLKLLPFWFTIGLLHFKEREAIMHCWTHPLWTAKWSSAFTGSSVQLTHKSKEVKQLDQRSPSALFVCVPIKPSRGPQCPRHVFHWPSTAATVRSDPATKPRLLL